MQTRPHLTQIQSTDMDKHPHLLDELIELLGHVDFLLANSVKGIYNSFEELNVAEGKVEGFYKVIIDETYKNAPTEYYYDGTDLFLLGDRVWDAVDDLQSRSVKSIFENFSALELGADEVGFYKVLSDESYRDNPTEYFYDGSNFHFMTEKIPQEVLKKTAVFYIKQLSKQDQTVSLFIPYKGVLKSMFVSLSSPSGEDTLIDLIKGEGVEGHISVPGGSISDSLVLEGVVDYEPLSISVNGELMQENISVCVDILPVEDITPYLPKVEVKDESTLDVESEVLVVE